MHALVRASYGVLQLLTLGAALPHAHRYFRSERWGGYAESGRVVDLALNPVVSALMLIAWLAAAIGLAAGRAVLLASTVNLVLCYLLFIRMRWNSVLRGMGAPGFISYWLGAAVCLLEWTARHQPALGGLALLTLQVDFAAIMISAGLYKLCSGYRSGRGMELGMVNPEWGYWPDSWRRWPPGHAAFRFFNEMAWTTEVGAGVLMLIPATRWLGALAIVLSFVFIATEIRLGFLCEMVIVCCLLFVPWGGGAAPAPPFGVGAIVFWTYLALLPLARVGLFYNQLAHKRLPSPVQRALDAYANLFGLIIWRVFTADIVNFFIRLWEEPADNGPRRAISDYGGFTWTHRFRQVAECITLTSVFTTLRYYPSNRALFEGRLLRYARTVPHAVTSRLVFEWVDITPRIDRFDLVPAAEYRVDLRSKTIEDVTLSGRVPVFAPAPASPVHEGERPGSYAPLRPRA